MGELVDWVKFLIVVLVWAIFFGIDYLAYSERKNTVLVECYKNELPRDSHCKIIAVEDR